MNSGNVILLAMSAVAAIALVYWLVTHFFAAEARWERRRRRSNAPIQSNNRRPSVRLSVRTGQKRRK